MGFPWRNLVGTTATAFKIGLKKAILDASALTASRTFTLPDQAGTMALTGDYYQVCNGRLTLESLVPYSGSYLSNQGTLYFTSCLGNRIGLYVSGAWNVYTFSQLSITNSGLAANTNYDAFVTYSAGTISLSLTAWTNNSTRATALASQDGVLVLSGSPASRYVGTIRTVAAGVPLTGGAFEFSQTRAFVQNFYNQRFRSLTKVGTAAHNYNGGIRAWNGDATLRWECVLGQTDEIKVAVGGACKSSAGGNICVQYAVVDSTSAGGDTDLGYYTGGYTGQYAYGGSSGAKLLAPGYHYVQAMQLSNATANNAYDSIILGGGLMC